ncbi:Zinc finger transcription factor-like protein [Emericellopsis cladophorae]|uniref:Zinc finger transcription factor-like protein n=1 Tax=Emericellopsis cladophorae TaxID=2686198 RepID=A0A9P9XY46_9HYPO|nr:Zinc finger transcription factor-like protein [Emericellopsis cladophorae]KAI6780041.1 Zinc finger transcription factor-like protein [Emericellopsis cladophorae]
MATVPPAIAHNNNHDDGLANTPSEPSEALDLEPDDHSFATGPVNHQLDGALEEEALPAQSRRDHVAMANGLHARLAGAPLTRKKMDEEAIAGTAVGAVLGVALLICCLYPLIVRQLKKHKRLNFDCEGGIRGMPALSVRRLSSSDSYKRSSLPREYDTHPYDSYRYTGVPQAPTLHYVNANLDPNIPIDPVTDNQHQPYQSPFPYYEGHVVQGPLAPHQYVLKGTNEDYYSPYIPSEAFGMFPDPEPVAPPPQPAVAASRGNSLRYNMKQIFRRKTVGDQATGPQPLQIPGHPLSKDMAQVERGLPMEQLVQQQPTTESPAEMSSRGLPPDEFMQQNRSQVYSSSQPTQSVMGTVNPMDIMAPSTESEMWHRTDYQLFTTPYDPQQMIATYPVQFQSLPSDYTQTQMPSNLTIPQPPQHLPPPPPPQSAPSAPPTQQRLSQKQSRTDSTASQSDSASRMGMTPLSLKASNTAAHSELSSSAQGTASTTTQSTPSTHVDSPSPESLNSSDYGHQGGSPHGNGVPSPRGGDFACDEPGCNQVFDQPHKLKHHQRYHSKDHKCPYPACGKGFGTKTHLQRHINDRHEKKKKFHCSIQGCDYSRAGGKAFPRKDNWKRHMTKIHGMDHRGLPEPIEVDSEMTGVKPES